MKVGISYAVELNEIPDELQKLIEEVQWELSEKLDLLTEQVKSGDFVSAFANIKNMRYNLQRTDTRLEDCNTILTGYLTVLKRLADEAEAEEARKKELGLGVRQSRPGPTKNTDAADD
jgi:uncharacterized protein (DUF849 family)